MAGDVAQPVPMTSPGSLRSWRRPALARAIVVVAILEVFAILGLSASGDARFRVGFDLVSIGFLGSVLLFPIVGGLIAQRRPDTTAPWLMLLIGLVLGTGLLAYGYGSLGMGPPRRPFALEAVIASQLFFLPGLGLGSSILLLIFPTDHLPSRRWRPVVAAAVIGTILYEVGTLLHPGELDPQAFPGVANPIGLPDSMGWLTNGLVIAGNGALTVVVLLAALSLVLRYRRADPIVAAQIRWIALIATVAGPLLALSALQLEGWGEIAYGCGLVVLALTPVAIGIAITRYRLYEIDRLINRALVYGSLTAILAGVFTAAVSLAQRLFVSVTGERSDAAIVLTTLVVATLYAPLRKRLEALVDRQFKYERRRFGAYGDEIRRVIAVIDPQAAAQRLAAETMRELGSTGTAVLDREGRVVATAGAWPPDPPVDEVIEIEILGSGPGIGAVRIAPRPRGEPYDPEALLAVREIAPLAASAVRPANAE